MLEAREWSTRRIYLKSKQRRQKTHGGVTLAFVGEKSLAVRSWGENDVMSRGAQGKETSRSIELDA